MYYLHTSNHFLAETLYLLRDEITAVPLHEVNENLSCPSFWITETTRKKSQLITFRQGMRLVMSHGPYVKLVIGFLFTSLAFMVTLPLAFAFEKHVGNSFVADSVHLFC